MAVFNVVGATGATLSLLKVGSKGNAVKTWQNALNWTVKSKSPISTDGIFGNQTKAATIELQKYLNIPADGIVGPQTIKAYQARWPNYISRIDLTEQEQPGLVKVPEPSTSKDYLDEQGKTPVISPTTSKPSASKTVSIPSYTPPFIPSEQSQSSSYQYAPQKSDGFMGVPLLAWGALALGGVLVYMKKSKKV